MRRIKASCIAALLLLSSVSGFAADPKPTPITMKIRVIHCFAPCDTRVDVQVERHPANALFRIRFMGDNYERYSEINMERHPAKFEIWYKGLPAGEYVVLADLVRHDGKTWIEGTAAAKVTVIATTP